MKKEIISLILMLNIFAAYSLGQKNLITQRSRTQLREGPACYYPVIVEIKRNTIVVVSGEEQDWLNISVKDKMGWVAKNALKEPEESCLYDMDPFKNATLIVTPASVSAAVKGFSQNFVSTRLGKVSEYDLYNHVDFDIAQYTNFYKETFDDRNPMKVQKRRKLSRFKSTMEYSIELEKIGYSVSLALASSMELADKHYENYLNQVVTLVGSNSHWYDVQFKVLVLNSETPTAYATPCGIVFLTTALLDLIQNESELATLLGHEIAHVIFGHGYSEIQERKEMLLAEEAFQELNMELDEEISEVERELTELASEIYDFLVRNRLDDYEEEADKWGMTYAYRAGYNPYALITVLNRIQSKKPIKKEIWEMGHWWMDSMEGRIQNAEKFIIKELSRKPEYNRLFSERFHWAINK